MKLYSHVYNYCVNLQVHKPVIAESRSWSIQGKTLYQIVQNYIIGFLDSIKLCINENGDELLGKFVRQWENYKFSSRVCNAVFEYANKNFKMPNEEKVSDCVIYDLAMKTWKSRIFNHLSDALCNTILIMIERERNGGIINTFLVSSTVQCFCEMGLISEQSNVYLDVYKRNLEEQIFIETEIFYHCDSASFLMKNTETAFITYIEQKLLEEEKRVQTYLHESSKEGLLGICGNILINQKMEIICHNFQQSLEDKNDEDLARIYHVVARIPENLIKLKEILEKFVHTQGLDEIAKQGEDCSSTQYVEALLNVHARFTILISVAFENNSLFLEALDKGCLLYVNSNNVTRNNKMKTPESLAKYSDNILRKSSKSQGDRDLDTSIERVMIVFNYLYDKDVFLEFYSSLFAKRLILKASISDDAEALMITKLKRSNGYDYTTKLQKMHQDIALSRSLNLEYKNYVADKVMDQNVNFQIMVLTSGSWPFNQGPSLKLPVEVNLTMNISLNISDSNDFLARRYCSELHQILLTTTIR
jgi:cullin 1